MQSASNIFTILKQAVDFLTSHNITEAQIDAEVLLCDVLHIKRSKLFTIRQETIPQEQYNKFQEYVNRRANREPVAYITGKTEFMDLIFNVNSNVLIPRQETELIVEQANNFIQQNNSKNILDMCTGSGCIATSVAYYNKDSFVTAVDISTKAIEVAKQNAELNKINNIEFINSDMFTNIIDKKFDIIISNPPYVTVDEYKNLEKEIYFEPENAFLADFDGLTFYRIIAQNAKKYLNNKGIILLELNANISFKIAELFEDFLFVKIIKDYSGLDRILVAQNG